MGGHPNAVASTIALAAAWLAVTLLTKYTTVDLSQNAIHGIDMGSSAVVLFIGRRGIRRAVSGAFKAVWNGSDPAPTTEPEPTPASVPVQAEPTEGVTT